MPDKIFAISKAIREMLGKGVLTGYQRECHYMLHREAESMGEHKWLHTSNTRSSCRSGDYAHLPPNS